MENYTQTNRFHAEKRVESVELDECDVFSITDFILVKKIKINTRAKGGYDFTVISTLNDEIKKSQLTIDTAETSSFDTINESESFAISYIFSGKKE